MLRKMVDLIHRANIKAIWPGKTLMSPVCLLARHSLRMTTDGQTTGKNTLRNCRLTDFKPLFGVMQAANEIYYGLGKARTFRVDGRRS